MTVSDEQAVLVVEDLVDLLSLARRRTADRALHAAVRRVAQRHERGPHPSAVRAATAARLLGVSLPTVRSWIGHGVLEAVPGPGHPGLGHLAGQGAGRVARGGEGRSGRRRLVRVVDALRDRDLLRRAQEEPDTTDFVEYDEDDLAGLLRR